MAQGISLNEVVNITTNIASGGIGPSEFGTGMLLTISNSLPASGSGKVKRYTDLEQVKIDFGEDSPTSRDAAVWFAADPAPKALYIGRVVNVDAPTTIYTQVLDTAKLNILKVVTNGSFEINGTAVNDIVLTGQSISGIATKLQEKIRTISGYGGTTVTVTPSNDRLEIAFRSTTGAITGAVAITESDSGTQISNSDYLGIATNVSNEHPEGGEAYIRSGHPEETIESAIPELVSLSSSGRPTALMRGSDLPDDVKSKDSNVEIRNVAQNGAYITAVMDNNPFSSTAGEVRANSEVKTAKDANQSHSMVIYGNAVSDKTSTGRVDIAVLAKLSSQNFNLPQSIITLVPKPLQGVETVSVDATQKETLEKNNASVYTTAAGYPAFFGGKSANGTWIDAQWWLAWLKSEMENNIFNAMRQSNRMTNSQLRDTIHQVMSKAINTGGIQLGGTVNTALKHQIRQVTNNPGFDGVLRNGYLIWIQPDQTRTDVDRANRHAAFKVWISPSEAIHSVDGGIVLNG